MIPPLPMNGHDSSLRLILDRFESLEASHHKLRQQFELFVQEKTRKGSSKTSPESEEMTSDSKPLTSFPGRDCFPGSYFFVSPYRSVLEYMGHAVHVNRPGSGEIIYWNFAAEKLYGYKNYEVVGQSAVELLFDEEHHASVLEIMNRLSTGESWSGQLPLKKRSGQSFMAMINTTPLYEEGKVTGIITVSSDATLFNNSRFGRNRTHNQNHANEQPKYRRRDLKKIQWQPHARVLALPKPSSISNLKRGDVTCDRREIEESEVQNQDVKADRPPRVPTPKPMFGLSLGRNEGMSSEKEESTLFVQPPKLVLHNFTPPASSKSHKQGILKLQAVKILSKLQRGPIENSEKVAGDNTQQTIPADDRAIRNGGSDETCFHKELDDARSNSPKNPTLGDGSGSGPRLLSSTISESDCHIVLAGGNGMAKTCETP